VIVVRRRGRQRVRAFRRREEENRSEGGEIHGQRKQDKIGVEKERGGDQ